MASDPETAENLCDHIVYDSNINENQTSPIRARKRKLTESQEDSCIKKSKSNLNDSIEENNLNQEAREIIHKSEIPAINSNTSYPYGHVTLNMLAQQFWLNRPHFGTSFPDTHSLNALKYSCSHPSLQAYLSSIGTSHNPFYSTPSTSYNIGLPSTNDHSVCIASSNTNSIASSDLTKTHWYDSSRIPTVHNEHELKAHLHLAMQEDRLAKIDGSRLRVLRLLESGAFPMGIRANKSPRRQRTTFTNEQTIKLELEYRKNEYISRNKRFQLADSLRLSENQIKIWFQNRRAKDKRIEKAIVDQQCRFTSTNLEAFAGHNMEAITHSLDLGGCSTCSLTKHQFEHHQ